MARGSGPVSNPVTDPVTPQVVRLLKARTGERLRRELQALEHVAMLDMLRRRRLELRIEPRKVPAFVDALSGLSDSG